MRYAGICLPLPSSVTVTTLPIEILSESSLSSTITACSRISSNSAMREYSLPCSFFASSYSLFSLRSPKPRASLISSATSSARVVLL